MPATTKKPRLTWRKLPSDDLTTIRLSSLDLFLVVDGHDVGRVSPLDGRWFWTAHSERLAIGALNMCNHPLPTIDEAKAACAAYVRECLERAAGEAVVGVEKKGAVK